MEGLMANSTITGKTKKSFQYQINLVLAVYFLLMI